jgi:hypothetical protein
VVEVLVFLGLARLAVLTIPFRFLARILGPLAKSDGHGAARQETAQSTLELGRLIERVARHTPWSSNCLAKAIAAKIMLRRRGVATTLVFGVARTSEGKLEAHAWTRSGEAILTGSDGIDRYFVVAAFAETVNE